jgi:hypothetical protein
MASASEEHCTDAEIDESTFDSRQKRAAFSVNYLEEILGRLTR